MRARSLTWTTEGSIRSITCGSATRRRGSRGAAGLYYLVKPLLPRSVQIELRRRHAARRAQREFPRWPIEDVLVRHQEETFRRAIQRSRRRQRAVRQLLARRPPLRVRAHPRRRGAGGHREHRARPQGRARSRRRLVVELRRRGLPDPGRPVREAARRRLRDRAARHPPQPQALAQREDVRADAAEDPPLPRRLAGRRMALAGHVPQRRLDAAARRPLRQLVPGHGPVRAAGGRLLLDLPVLPRRHGRAPDHARPGPHDVGAPAAPGDRPMAREERVDQRRTTGW